MFSRFFAARACLWNSHTHSGTHLHCLNTHTHTRTYTHHHHPNTHARTNTIAHQHADTCTHEHFSNKRWLGINDVLFACTLCSNVMTFLSRNALLLSQGESCSIAGKLVGMYCSRAADFVTNRNKTVRPCVRIESFPSPPPHYRVYSTSKCTKQKLA